MSFGESMLGAMGGAAAADAAAHATRAVAAVEEVREQVLIVRRNTIGIDRNIISIGRALGLWLRADEPDETVVTKPWADLERRVEGIEQTLERIERMLAAEKLAGGGLAPPPFTPYCSVCGTGPPCTCITASNLAS